MFSKCHFPPRLACIFGLTVLLPPFHNYPVKTVMVTFAKTIQQMQLNKGSCKMNREIFFDRKKKMENNKGQN